MKVDAGKPKGRLMNQKDIAEEYGLTTRDVLRAVAAKNSRFPAPVRIIGKKRWFSRAEIARYFNVRAQADGDDSPLPS